jgi:putative oxidoreductase
MARTLTAAPALRGLYGRLVALGGMIPEAPIRFAMRLAVAAVFFNSGLLKINSWELTLLLFRDEYQLPVLPTVLAAQMATALELAVPPFLAAGLLARLATLPLLGMVAVIQIFVYPQAWPEHLLWASILLFVLARGPGAWSLDRLVGIER